MTFLIFFAALSDAAPPAQAPVRTDDFNPRVIELFERDWVLMKWAVRQFDRDGNGVISLEEAQPAAIQFRDIADGDRDGRITPYEYDRAREFIVARY